jgi:pyruvate/2-oxoglutarate dehydrogenase complex dihydrolipoamide dehydrogenase (E3) component
VPPGPRIAPDDVYNRALVSHVHPEGWKNPEPLLRYNLVVLGAGTAGLVTAAIAAGLGAQVALIERDWMGGDCLNVGCVPSKTVIRSARALADVRGAGPFGVQVPPGVEVDFARVMERMRAVRAGIAPHDSAQRFRDELGVHVFFGSARFSGPDSVEVEGARLRFTRAVIATGARAAAPPIEGLKQAGYLTNETVFSLTERPRRLAAIGAGPIGCELAQSFARLGSQVTLFEVEPQILGREDRDAAAIVERALAQDGVQLVLGARIERVESTAQGKWIHYRAGERSARLLVDEILIGAGRQPNVEDLALEQAGVRWDARSGVAVDDRLRTANPRIYAAGDVCMAAKFTHAADAAAKIVVQNALFFRRLTLSSLIIPRCTYTDPEVASVGLLESEARQRGVEIDTFTVPLAKNDRAQAEGELEGLLKIHVRKGSDAIVGATIVARHAGEMISQITTAMAAKIGLGRLAYVIHPYPTQGELLRAAAGLYTRTRLTPWVAGLFRWFLRLRR